MRKKYHFRSTDRGVLIWDVDRLVEVSRGLIRKPVPIDAIRELDETYWATDGVITCHAVVEHARLIQEEDLSFPIILSADGRIMDGMHRVGNTLLEGREAIEAVQFQVDPEPDYVELAQHALQRGPPEIIGPCRSLQREEAETIGPCRNPLI